MSEGGSVGRSCNRIGAEGIRQGCSLWVDPQIGLSAKTSSTRIMVSPPVLCLSSQLEMGWGDQSGLTKMGKQRMPGSCERGIVTVRRFFAAYARAEALSAGPGGLTRRLMSAIRDPWRRSPRFLPIFVRVVWILRREERPEARIKTCR